MTFPTESSSLILQDARPIYRRRLDAAARVLGFKEDIVDQLFGGLTDSWLGDFEASTRQSSWVSDISDNGCPVEVSVALGGVPELRFLVEAQSVGMDAEGAFAAGRRLSDSLLRFPGVSLKRFEAVEDLFAPKPGQESRFSLWHAGVARPDGQVAFKLYLNPQMTGRNNGLHTSVVALERLGLGEEARALTRFVNEGEGSLECLYFSLDLDSRQGSRVKVYVAHRNATLRSIERDLFRLSPAAAWDARQALQTLVGEGPYTSRPVLSCLGFKEGQSSPQYTLHIPIRCYASSDAEALEHLERLAPLPLSSSARKIAEVTAEKSLVESTGHIAYISTKRDQGIPKLTLYLTATDGERIAQSSSNTITSAGPTIQGVVPQHGAMNQQVNPDQLSSSSETRIKIPRTSRPRESAGDNGDPGD